MYLEEDHRSDEIRVRCYDGHWKREGSFLEFTGRGCVKFSDGEFRDGEFACRTYMEVGAGTANDGQVDRDE